MIIAPVNPLGYDELAALAAVASSSGSVPQMEVDGETTRKMGSSKTCGTSLTTSSLRRFQTGTVKSTYVGQESEDNRGWLHPADSSEEILKKPCESPSHAKGKANEMYEGDGSFDETGSVEGGSAVSNSDLTEPYSDNHTKHPVGTSSEASPGIPKVVGFTPKTDGKSSGHNGRIIMTSYTQDYTQETAINSKSRYGSSLQDVKERLEEAKEKSRVNATKTSQATQIDREFTRLKFRPLPRYIPEQPN